MLPWGDAKHNHQSFECVGCSMVCNSIAFKPEAKFHFSQRAEQRRSIDVVIIVVNVRLQQRFGTLIQSTQKTQLVAIRLASQLKYPVLKKRVSQRRVVFSSGALSYLKVNLSIYRLKIQFIVFYLDLPLLEAH